MSESDDKTRLIRRSSSPDPNTMPGYGAPSQPSYIPPPGTSEETVYRSPSRAGDLDPTRLLNRDGQGGPGPGPGQQRPVVPDSATVLVRPSSKSAPVETPGQTPAPAAAAAEELPDGPVVGWLVVVEGPGRGRSVTLGYGMNSIGREAGRVCLPFGDMHISKARHATLTYDPRGKKYFIQHGESSNLTYLGDQPVLSPLEVKAGDLIRLGDKTVLRFVPLCGDDFDWE